MSNKMVRVVVTRLVGIEQPCAAMQNLVVSTSAGIQRWFAARLKTGGAPVPGQRLTIVASVFTAHRDRLPLVFVSEVDTRVAARMGKVEIQAMTSAMSAQEIVVSAKFSSLAATRPSRREFWARE
ncbi:hypothetical protein WBP07_20650 (plasmid) [Novosphingobium sp. BL-8A]|uniref:hypothetical protein n=1 Tax=Novosphingobium sp. BL-8A TaxID=3127639 RepID=UPI003757AB32